MELKANDPGRLLNPLCSATHAADRMFFATPLSLCRFLPAPVQLNRERELRTRFMTFPVRRTCIPIEKGIHASSL
jgi:hypothetical protein